MLPEDTAGVRSSLPLQLLVAVHLSEGSSAGLHGCPFIFLAGNRRWPCRPHCFGGLLLVFRICGIVYFGSDVRSKLGKYVNESVQDQSERHQMPEKSSSFCGLASFKH